MEFPATVGHLPLVGDLGDACSCLALGATHRSSQAVWRSLCLHDTLRATRTWLVSLDRDVWLGGTDRVVKRFRVS